MTVWLGKYQQSCPTPQPKGCRHLPLWPLKYKHQRGSCIHQYRFGQSFTRQSNLRKVSKVSTSTFAYYSTQVCSSCTKQACKALELLRRKSLSHVADETMVYHVGITSVKTSTKHSCNTLKGMSLAELLQLCLPSLTGNGGSEAVQNIDFSHSSLVAWSTLNNLSGRSRQSPRQCLVLANAETSQLVKTGKYEGANREISHSVTQELSDRWRDTSPDAVNISGDFSPREFAAALHHLKPGKVPGPDSTSPEFLIHAGPGLKS